MQLNPSRTIVYYLPFILSLAFGVQTNAQYNSSSITIDYENQSVPDAIRSLAEKSKTVIVFGDDFFKSVPYVTQRYIGHSLTEILVDLLSSSDLDYKWSGNAIVIFRKKQKKYHLHGYIIDTGSGERLPYALISIAELNESVISNEEGYYNFALAKGSYTLESSYLGHHTLQHAIAINQNAVLNLEMTSSTLLPEVFVDNTHEQNLQEGRNQYTNKDLMERARKTPGFGGSNDLLQTVKVLPGVQSGAGGIGGYYIRGGSNDQNLYLLDGVAIYNPFHSLGMASIFTPQTTKNLQVIKSGFRAQYGGRSASVLDIRLKDGNQEAIKAAAGINPQDGFVKVEGPLPVKNSSFFIYGRNTTSTYKFNDIIRQSLFNNVESENQTKYYDLIGKAAISLNATNKLFATFFRSFDRLEAEEETEFEDENVALSFRNETNLTWGNQIYNLRWQSLLASKVFLNTSLSYNQYGSSYGTLESLESEIEGLEDFFFTEISSLNEDIAFKIDVDFNTQHNIRLKSGMGYLKKSFIPNFDVYDEDSEEISGIDSITFDQIESIDIGNKFYSHKLHHYLEGTFDYNRFHLQLGLRSTLYTFEDNRYFHLQPRVNADYRVNHYTSVAFSASKVVQYVHLLSSSEVSLPRDLWYPSSRDLPPEETWHFNSGIKSSINSHLNISAELYYKGTKNKSQSSNLIYDYGISVPSLFSNSGLAKSYGMEVEVISQIGKWQGFWTYALSKSRERYNDLNLGRTYDFQFDRNHEFKTTHTIALHPNLVLGVNTYISSGHPLLVIDNIDLQNGLNPIDINPEGQKNVKRTPSHHRLDLSLLYSVKQRRFNHDLKLNLYNLYNNQLPLYYTQSHFSGTLQPQFSIPFIPSISYTLSFN